MIVINKVDGLLSVVTKDRHDLVWCLGQDNSQYPTIKIKRGEYDQSVSVDPFPCYSHSPMQVAELLEECYKVFPIPTQIKYYLFEFERLDRSNGTTYVSSGYNKEAPSFGIVFSGKRIPIHPAMTRYLVAHEYGHCVETWLDWVSKKKEGETLKEYAEFRGLSEKPESYGGGWHLTPAEVFANDFRVVLVKREREFWPHPVPRPEDVIGLHDKWFEYQKLVKGC